MYDKFSCLSAVFVLADKKRLNFVDFVFGTLKYKSFNLYRKKLLFANTLLVAK